MSLQRVCLSSRGFLSGEFCLGFVCLEGFVWGGFCPAPLLSEYICYNRKPIITFNFRFHMYEKIWKVWRHMLLDLPPPVTDCHTFLDSLPHRAWRTLWTTALYQEIEKSYRRLLFFESSTRGFKSQVAEGVNFIVFKTHYDWLYVYYMHLHNSLLSRRWARTLCLWFAFLCEQECVSGWHPMFIIAFWSLRNLAKKKIWSVF